MGDLRELFGSIAGIPVGWGNYREGNPSTIESRNWNPYLRSWATSPLLHPFHPAWSHRSFGWPWPLRWWWPSNWNWGAVIPPGKGLRSALGLREGGKLIRPQYIHFYRSSTADTCILSFTFHCCVRSSIWIHKVEWAVCGKIGSVGHRLLYNWRNNYREGSSGTTEHRDRSSD